MNLACRALESHQTILNLIGSTTTTGLAVTAKLDTGDYSTGIRITDREVKTCARPRPLARRVGQHPAPHTGHARTALTRSIASPKSAVAHDRR